MNEQTQINCNGLQVWIPSTLRSDIHKCRNLHLRLARTANHIAFLRRCRRNKIVPKGLKPKLPTIPGKNNLQEKFGLTILNQQLNVLYKKKRDDQREERVVRERIQRNLDVTTWTLIWTWILVCEREVFLSIRETQCKKFEKLQAESECNARKNHKSETCRVVNLSSKELSKDQIELLSKGLNFVPSSNTKITPAVIANTEVVTRYMGDRGKALVHLTKAYINNNHKKETNSLTKGERVVLKQLKEDDSLIITNSDKGKTVVVMDKGSYNAKMCELLASNNYIKLQGDPLVSEEKALIRKLTKLRDSGVLDNDTLTSIRHSNSNIPFIYGCPKLHKEGFPLRPIVSTIGTPWSTLAKHLCEILNPIAYPNDTTSLKNTEHFVSLLRNITLEEDCTLVSLDVKNLFGSVPVDKCLQVVRERLQEDMLLHLRTQLPISTIMELITICVKTTFFKYDKSFYKQLEGLAMGCPLSPALANIFLQYIEKEMSKGELYNFVKFLKKFVDDYFMLWAGSRDTLEGFKDFINNIEESINFTMEIEVNGELPFLDVKVSKNDNKLSTRMYEKDIASGMLLNFNSDHPSYIKRNIVSNLSDKVKKCSDQVEEDLNNLRIKLKQNAYPAKMVNNIVTGNRTARNNQEKVKRPKLTIPFKRNHASFFKRKAKDLNVDVIFKRNRNIGEILNKAGKCKDKRNTNIVYKINCKCGEFYIGETGREIDVRICDHKRDIVNKKLTNGIARHVVETGHEIDFENWELLDRETNETKRRLREAYYINKLKASLNLTGGYDINDLWFTGVTVKH